MNEAMPPAMSMPRNHPSPPPVNRAMKAMSATAANKLANVMAVAPMDFLSDAVSFR